MSAEVLRRAAVGMRESAEGCRWEMAVADLLESIADENDHPEGSLLAFLDFVTVSELEAVTVARTYLGEQP